MSSSGASDARGASHCTSTNSLTPSSVPVSTSDSAKCSAHKMTVPAATANMATTARRRRLSSSPPMYSAGPTRWGSPAGAREMRTV